MEKCHLGTTVGYGAEPITHESIKRTIEILSNIEFATEIKMNNSSFERLKKIIGYDEPQRIALNLYGVDVVIDESVSDGIGNIEYNTGRIEPIKMFDKLEV